mgnify:FL=1|jgi:hypothetical protein|nr:MAG TPA: hypothetical protein [Caudoviricetes sp.]
MNLKELFLEYISSAKYQLEDQIPPKVAVEIKRWQRKGWDFYRVSHDVLKMVNPLTSEIKMMAYGADSKTGWFEIIGYENNPRPYGINHVQWDKEKGWARIAKEIFGDEEEYRKAKLRKGEPLHRASSGISRLEGIDKFRLNSKR